MSGANTIISGAGPDLSITALTEPEDGLVGLPFRHKVTLYLGGKIYLDQLRIAMRLSPTSAGAAMLYLLVHHLTSLNAGKSRWVKLTQEALRRFGLSRKHKDKWLDPLAEAGLIAVKRRGRTSKRAIEVRLLPRVQEPDGADEHTTH